MEQQVWEQEWEALVRWRDEALAHSRRLQTEVSAALRRRQPPAMQLLRAADAAETNLNLAKARLKAFLRQLGDG